MVLEVLQHFLELTPKKRCPFHYRGLECKSRKSRDAWSNRQIRPWSTEWRRAKANRVLPRECTGHSKHPLPTTQQKTLHKDITRWSILKSDWLYSCSQRWRSSLESKNTRLGADCGSDHGLLIVKFRLKLKKVGKTTIPFRYDINQIPYDYMMEVRNRFKRLDLVDRRPEELWTEVHNMRRWCKPIAKEKKCKKANWLSKEALQTAEKRSERQRRKGKIYPTE